jgi:hypothetical protein
MYGFPIFTSAYDVINANNKGNNNVPFIYCSKSPNIIFNIPSGFKNMKYLYNIVLKMYETANNTINPQNYGGNNITIVVNYNLKNKYNNYNMIFFDVINGLCKNRTTVSPIHSKNDVVETEFPVFNKQLLDNYKKHYNTVKKLLLVTKKIKITGDLLHRINKLLELFNKMYNNKSLARGKGNSMKCLFYKSNNMYNVGEPLNKSSIGILINKAKEIIGILEKYITEYNNPKQDNLYEFITYISTDYNKSNDDDSNNILIMNLIELLCGNFQDILQEQNCNILYMYDVVVYYGLYLKVIC